MAATAQTDRNSTAASVLLVDDDSFVLRLLAAVFKRRGISVATANSGEEALELLDETRPELIIADVMMPGISGYELCRQVRARGYEDIPFIFCSALSSLSERVTGLRAGADDYITKPVNTEELVLRISAHLERIRQMRQLKRQALPGQEPGPPPADVMAGQIGGLTVADILQVAALLRKGRLAVHLQHPEHGDGAVYLSGARVTHAQYGTESGRRALLRVLEWQQGSFRIDEAGPDVPESMSELLDEAILQGLAELDERRALREALPTRGLRVLKRAEAVRRRFDAATAEVLALLEVHHELETLVRSSSLSEMDTLRILGSLVAEGIVGIDGDAPPP